MKARIVASCRLLWGRMRRRTRECGGLGRADAFVVLPVGFLAFPGTVEGTLAFCTALEGICKLSLELATGEAAQRLC